MKSLWTVVRMFCLPMKKRNLFVAPRIMRFTRHIYLCCSFLGPTVFIHIAVRDPSVFRHPAKMRQLI